MRKIISINLKGRDSCEIEAGSLSALDSLKKLKIKAIDRVLAVKINGKISDLSILLNDQAELVPVYFDSEEGLEILRHSTSHVMAMAVKELFPGVKVTIGPAIKDGFYYDFDYKRPFREDDLPKIEAKMKEIIDEDLPFFRKELPASEAIDFFKKEGEDYKVELIEDLNENKVSLYTQGSFTDLCLGPHIPSTRKIKAFHLTKVAGAYWRGDEKRTMLSRIYGVCFSDRKKLKEHLHNLEEAKRRDHVKLGPQIGLFNTYNEIGAGMIVWHPNGAMLRHIIEQFEVAEHIKRGYELVKGPEILKTELWEKSGHFDNYRENMYFTMIDKQSYGIKPMNCLAHMLIYRSKIRSYRDLPKRYFELGTVHRHERSGVLHGLFRVREFTQDDAHIICTPEQLNDEIKSVLDFVNDIMKIFNFDYDLEISTRPQKSIGTDEDWELATKALIKAMEDNDLKYDINEGDGAFYGPKIDYFIKDAIGREWQGCTIQLDFNMPERFDLVYFGSDGQKHRPIMIHRAIIGSLERFLGVLTEHTAGDYPLWLSPVQVVVMNITDEQQEYAQSIAEELKSFGIRVQVDDRNEKVGFKIREAELQKIPYILVVGNREKEAGQVSVRVRKEGDIGTKMLSEFVMMIKEKIKPPESR